MSVHSHQADIPGDIAAFHRADSRYLDKSADTICVHAGERAAPLHAKTSTTPIHLSTTFFYDKMQSLDDVLARRAPGYAYSRYSNPTTNALERALAALEGADAAIACSSGMAAIHLTLLSAGLGAGDAILCSADVYGGTYALVANVLPQMGVHPIFADFSDLEEVERLLQEKRPKLVLFELVTNPLLKVVDAPRVIELAHDAGAFVLLDNTFATPLAFRPMEYGADFVVHSLTKFIAGHGDVLAGAVLFRDPWFETFYSHSILIGAALDPFSAYLALRGLKTFPLRFERQCANALRIAEFLAAHPKVSRVYYPGLESHPGYELAGRLLAGGLYGAVLSFELRGGNKERAFRFMEALKLILPATTLGDVQSTILYPAHSSHAALSDEELAKVGISPGLLRLSAGIEKAEDVMEDLDYGLSKI